MSALGGIGGRLYRGEVSVDFVGRRRLWYSISGAILAISAVGLLVFGLNFSVDFKGGSLFKFPTGTESISQVRRTVSAAGGGSDAIIQQVTDIANGKSDWNVQTHPLSAAQQTGVSDAIARAFHVTQSQISTTFVGQSWGSQISLKALEALIAFLIVIVFYLSIMFEWKMAAAALVALMHDIIITVGVYALLRFQVSPASVIGLLTILGYSLYDTVVVFDKVRENTAGLLASGRATYSQAANQALNQTLVRSINTSVIALLPVAAILFIGAGLLGAGELKDLALVLFVGMLSGTYSSICIATPVLADLKEREPQYKSLAKRVAQRAAGGRAAARRAARAFSDGDTLDKLEQSLGGTAMVRMFADIGERMTEDRLVGAGGGDTTAGPEQAKAEIARIRGEALKDPKHALNDRFHPEHGRIVAKLEKLYTAAYPEAPA